MLHLLLEHSTDWFSTLTLYKFTKPSPTITPSFKTDKQVIRHRSTIDVLYLQDLLFKLFHDCATNHSRRTEEVSREKDALQASPVGRLGTRITHWLRSWPKVTHLTVLHSCVSTSLCYHLFFSLFVKNNHECLWTACIFFLLFHLVRLFCKQEKLSGTQKKKSQLFCLSSLTRSKHVNLSSVNSYKCLYLNKNENTGLNFYKWENTEGLNSDVACLQ